MPATLNRHARRAQASDARRESTRPGWGVVVERLSISESGSNQFRVDRDKGIIYGSKVYGLHSPNNHNRPRVTEGTDYPPELHRSSLSIFEGQTIYGDHPDKRQDAGKVRSVDSAVAVIKNCRFEADGTYADLHVNTQRELGRAMLEDAEKKLGMFALSINAMPSREKIVAGRLVIEAFEFANSVDLVTRGGTNRNLWESQEQKTVKTFQAILEAWVKGKTDRRKKWAASLYEDGDMGSMDVATDSGEGGEGEPEDQLWAGIEAAISAIINGDGTADEKAKKVAKYLKAHEKLTSEPEPDADPEVEEEDDTDEDKKDKKDDKDMKESKELRTVRAENSCLKAGVNPTPELLEALENMPTEAKRSKLLESFKGAPTTPSKVKSSTPGSKKQAVTEHKAPQTAEEFAKSIRD